MQARNTVTVDTSPRRESEAPSSRPKGAETLRGDSSRIAREGSSVARLLETGQARTPISERFEAIAEEALSIDSSLNLLFLTADARRSFLAATLGEPVRLVERRLAAGDALVQVAATLGENARVTMLVAGDPRAAAEDPSLLRGWASHANLAAIIGYPGATLPPDDHEAVLDLIAGMDAVWPIVLPGQPDAAAGARWDARALAGTAPSCRPIRGRTGSGPAWTHTRPPAQP